MDLEEPESTWESIIYGKFISQYQPDIIICIQRFESIKIKICKKNRISIIFNQICLNEKMVPNPPPIHIYIYDLHVNSL